ncbi:MAG: hypothetical protein JST86_02090 [Bacteroidetes bacterium]|nr:hypothetical protein [Bacteroidota bacterium]
MITAGFYNNIKQKARQVYWPLLLVLLLVLNVKLVVKVAAVVLICIINRKQVHLKDFISRRYLLFYFGMMGIAVINLLLHYRQLTTIYFATVIIGMAFWMMSAVIAYNSNLLIQKGSSNTIHFTISLFFILHIACIFLNLLLIVWETKSLNPYAFRGLNQKYYISTGDAITGITFDAPVTTAFIAAFAVIYFLYRKQFIAMLAAMAALLVLASNFANMILVAVLIFCFIFYSNGVQKSIIGVCFTMLVIFMARVSPQNYEHVGRIFYSVINKPYDLPKEKVLSLEEIKTAPDSILSAQQKKQKTAAQYIDSVNSVEASIRNVQQHPAVAIPAITETTTIRKNIAFYSFKESNTVEEKINSNKAFLLHSFTPEQTDSLDKLYNWKHPGKWIAALQLVTFFKTHPNKILLGNGVANFSSRLAYKATGLNMAGQYPAKLKYIHPDFLNNHLLVYLHYHALDQSNHEASNTPDAAYFQVAGEYGAAGLIFLAAFFLYFFRYTGRQTYALPLLLLLAGSFFAEYWFEQFSIVVLFEILLFTHIKDQRGGELSS